MKFPPAVTEANPSHSLATATNVEDLQSTSELQYDRFPLVHLTEEGRDAEILMLGGVPLFMAISVIVVIMSARLIKWVSERNDLGVTMRSSEGES